MAKKDHQEDLFIVNSPVSPTEYFAAGLQSLVAGCCALI